VAIVCALFAVQSEAFAQTAAKVAPPASAQVATDGGRVSLPADLPLRRDADSPAMTSMGYVIWLLVVVAGAALLWAVRSQRGAGFSWLMRPRRDDHQTALSVLGARSLGPSSSLQVVRWGGKEFLLGCTSQSICVLDSRVLPGTAGNENSGAGVDVSSAARGRP
jgi:flagellar biogenesis protein FliO